MDRGTDGRFAEGNAIAKGTTTGPNSGRPSDETKRKLAEKLYQLCEGEWDEVISAMIERAKQPAGHNDRKLLLMYVLGTPEQVVALRNVGSYTDLLDALREADKERAVAVAAQPAGPAG